MVKSQNKKALELMDERYKEWMLQYFAKTKLLEEMADETFTVSGYMQTKQEAMLDAMELVAPGNTRQRRQRKRKADDFPTDWTARQSPLSPKHPTSPSTRRDRPIRTPTNSTAKA